MKIVNLVKMLMVFVGISGVFSVLFGAWLAHGGQGLPEMLQLRLNTAVQYQFIHTLALFITLVWCLNQPSKWLIVAGLSFCFGILSFSGTLYLKAFFDFSLISKLTPLGGMLFAFGWACLGFAGAFLIKSQTNK